jgi:hypothetical protein
MEICRERSMKCDDMSAREWGCLESEESEVSLWNGNGEVQELGKRLDAWRYVLARLGLRNGKLTFVQSTLPTLPPIFALAASRSSSYLAIGCEDSTIRILNILDDELELISKIEVGGPGKVRALSLAWGPPVNPTTLKGKSRGESHDWIASFDAALIHLPP